MILVRSTAAMLTLAALAAPLAADDVQYFEKDGIRYQETTQVIQRPITETRFEPRESTVHRERLTTDMQESVRTYQVPVTEQQWVPGYQRTWNLFAPPVLSYRLMPVTRWETRTETVRVPITKREYVPERQVQHVPVTDTKIAEERVVRRVAVGRVPTGRGSAVARREEPAGDSSDDRYQDSTTEDSSHIDRRR